MREGITAAVRAGGRLRGRPQALAAFLAASAFAPFLAPAAGASEFGVLLSQLGSLGSGYLAALLTSAAEWNEPASLAMVIEAGLEAPGERGAGLRAEVSGALRQIGAVEAVMAADPQAARELAELGGQLAEFGWMLGDATEQLAQLVRLGARHGSDLQAARAELGALNALLQRLVPAQDQGREPTAKGPARCPYPGMRPFESRDAARFFGRENLTAHLLARLAEQASVPAPLLLFGPSGAGKSSLLRAGLIPAIRRGLLPVAGSARWPRFLVDRPGADPLAALAAAMGGLAADGDPFVIAAGLGPPGQFVLVVDQLEEIFTQCADGRARAHFVRVLVALAARGLVVLGVRADFYSDCAGIAELSALLADNQVVVGPLGEGDLRRAITLPAARAGYTVEAGLPELMIADLGLRPGQPGYAPGALPLLGYALQATWDRRAGAALTVAGYRDAGGIHGAVAAEAERIYEDLPAAGREAARRLLLRMVSVGPDGQLTRRRVSRAELLDGLEPAGPQSAGPGETGPGPAEQDGAGPAGARPGQDGPDHAGATGLARLTQARLVTADEDGAEITHEAFLTAWPRLAGWIAEDRAGLRVHCQLGEDARAWDRDGRDPGSLYRGTRLAAAAAWRAGHEAELTGLEREFLHGSTTAHQAVRRRERRQNRRLRILAAGLATALVAAVVASGVAVGKQRQALSQRSATVSGQFAAQSDDDLPVSLRTADLEALAAWQSSRTEAARSSLLSRQADPYLGSFPEQSDDNTTALAVSRDGKWMAVAEQPGTSIQLQQSSTIQVWNVASHRMTATFPDQGLVESLAFSPDDRTLAAAALALGPDHLRFWDVPSRTRQADPFSEPRNALITAVSYSPSGRALALGLLTGSSPTGPGVIDIWGTASHRRLRRLTGLTGYVTSLSFSPDGHLLAGGSDGGEALLWNAAAGTRLGTLVRGPDPVGTVLFSPDGQQVAVSADDEQVLLCDVVRDHRVGTRAVVFRDAGDASASPVAFGPGGRYLYAAIDGYDAVGAYDIAAGAQVGTNDEPPALVRYLAVAGSVMVGGGPGSLFALDLSPHGFVPSDASSRDAVTATTGGLVATGGDDGTIDVWPAGNSAAARPLASEESAVDGLGFSEGGRLLAAVYGNCDVRVWQPGTGRRPVVLRPPDRADGDAVSAASVAFVPGQPTLVTYCAYVTKAGSLASTLRVYDTSSWKPRAARQLAQPGTEFPASDSLPGDLAVSPDGRIIAADTGTGTVLLLSTGRYQVVRRIHTGQAAGLQALAFSDDSRLLATSSGTSGTGRVMLWRSPSGTPAGTFSSSPSPVRALVFSPDSTTLAVVSRDATVRLWNATAHRLDAELAALPATTPGESLPEGVNQVAFLPGRRLVTAMTTGAETVWDLSAGDEVHHLCAALDPAQVAAWWQAQRLPGGLEPCAAAPVTRGRHS